MTITDVFATIDGEDTCRRFDTFTAAAFALAEDLTGTEIVKAGWVIEEVSEGLDGRGMPEVRFRRWTPSVSADGRPSWTAEGWE